MRFRLLVITLAVASLALAGVGVRFRGDRPEREQHPAEGLAQRQAGAPALPRPRPPAARAGLGREERDRADPRPQAGRSSSSTTRAAGAPTARTSGRPSRIAATLRRPDDPVGQRWRARRPTARTGRFRSGSASCRTSGSAGRHMHGRLGAPPLALVGRAARVRRQAELDALGPQPHLRPPLRLPALPGQARARLPLDAGRRPARHLRAEHLRRHLQLEVRHGLEAGEQLPHAQEAPVSSATASTRTAGTRSARARSTAPR